MTASQLLLPQINLQQKQPQYILHSLHNSTHINTIWQIFHKDPESDISIGCSNSAFGNDITNFMNPYQFAAEMEHDESGKTIEIEEDSDTNRPRDTGSETTHPIEDMLNMACEACEQAANHAK